MTSSYYPNCDFFAIPALSRRLFLCILHKFRLEILLVFYHTFFLKTKGGQETFCFLPALYGAGLAPLFILLTILLTH